MSDVARLAAHCATLLEQARDLVLKLDADAFTRDGPAGGSSAGAHLRHCLEAFECLFAGLARGAVDYDQRRRDARLEAEPLAALARIDALRAALLDAIACEPDLPLRVRADEPELACADGFAASSLARELRFVASHTVHHFALIALQLRVGGVAIDPRFGVAPATWAQWQRAR